MDNDLFARLARSVASTSTRRAILAAGSALGVIPHLAEAIKRKKKKKKCKKCSICQTCNKKKGKCKAKPNGTACGPGTCQSGACVCPTECCSDQDCANGTVCLSNGSCAVTCDAQEDCPPDICQCGFPSVEGPSRCITNSIVVDPSCPEWPECSSTVNCLEGRHCQQTNCNGNPNRCVPLCAA